MTRKRTHRRHVVPLPPRGLRPRLAHDQLVDLGLAHLANLDAIATGRADSGVLWQTAGGVFTWSRVAELLHLGEPEMTTQLHVIPVEQFMDDGETSTDYSVLMDWARLGLLECTHFEVTKKGLAEIERLDRAATAAQEGATK